MNDQDDDKKNINQDSTEGNSENQPLVDETSQSESVKISSDDNLKNENQNVDQNNDQTNVFEASNEKKDENQDSVSKNNDTDPQGANENQSSDALSEKKDEEASSSHQVIHKKDGRLHIYVRQDKYKGELKSKNWVGRLYIDGKQKISSSGTTNLDEAIPIKKSN
jgi:type IV pilus assembly protein PilN